MVAIMSRKKDHASQHPPLSRISQNPELQSFIESCFKRSLTYSEIHAECLSIFGKDRAPSPDAIGGYFRAGLRADPKA